jgi:hypothetical protein
VTGVTAALAEFTYLCANLETQATQKLEQMQRKSIAITLVTLSGIVAAGEAAASGGGNCSQTILNANLVAALALLAIALWQFVRAFPHMRAVRKIAGFTLCLFPLAKTRNLPEYRRMWQHLGLFYGAIFAYIPVLAMVEALGC